MRMGPLKGVRGNRPGLPRYARNDELSVVCGNILPFNYALAGEGEEALILCEFTT